jgi:chaperonin GroEL
MASPFACTSTCGLSAAAPTRFVTKKQFSLVSPPFVSLSQKTRPGRKCNVRVNAAKELYFNKDGLAIRKLQVSHTMI